MAEYLSQREMDDLLAALSDGELDDTVPVKHPKFFYMMTKTKSFIRYNWITITVSVVLSLIASLSIIILRDKSCKRY